MRSFYRFSLVLSIFLLSCYLSQAQHSLEGPRLRHRRTDKPNGTFDAKYKRDDGATFTWFEVGEGACGVVNKSDDFIVALNSGQYAQGQHCFERIKITVGGKSAEAQITDECTSCAVGCLDFSPSLFEFFAPLSEGELHGSWVFNSDVATSSSTMVSSTTSQTTSTSATTSWTSMISTTSASTVPSPTPTKSTFPSSTPQDLEALQQIDLVLVELGVLFRASRKLGN